MYSGSSSRMCILVPYNLACMAWTRHYYYLQFPCYILALITYSFCYWELLPSPQSLKSASPACFQELNFFTSTDEILKNLHFRFHVPQFLLLFAKSTTFPLPISYLWYKIPANMRFQILKILVLYKKSKMPVADKMCKEKRTLARSWWGGNW